MHKLEKKTKRKRKQPPKRNINPISSYFHRKANTSRGKSQDGSDDNSHVDLDDNDDDDSDDDEDGSEEDNDDIDDDGDHGVGGTN